MNPEGRPPAPDRHIPRRVLRQRYWEFNGQFVGTHALAAVILLALAVYSAFSGMAPSVIWLLAGLILLVLASPFDRFRRIAFKSLGDLLKQQYAFGEITLDSIQQIVYSSRGGRGDSRMRLMLNDARGDSYICCLDRGTRFDYPSLHKGTRLRVAYMAKSRLVICLSAADPHPQKVRDQYQLTLLAPLLDHYRGSQPV